MSTDVLLFDLGGVVFPVEFEHALTHWASHAGVPVDSLRPHFRSDPWYERHERGEIDAGEYFDALRGRLGIAISDEEFAAGWNAIFEPEFSGARELFASLGARMPIYAFSNSNVVHKEFWERRYEQTLNEFRAVFVSCDLGLRKPEPEAFEHVIGAIGVSPERILFLDDTPENVHGARDVGMRAEHVSGFHDVRRHVAGFVS